MENANVVPAVQPAVISAAKVKAVKPKKVKAVKVKGIMYPRAASGSGVGVMARACIAKGYDFQKTFTAIKAKVPTTKFSKKCYYWYRAHTEKAPEIKHTPVKAVKAPAVKKVKPVAQVAPVAPVSTL